MSFSTHQQEGNPVPDTLELDTAGLGETALESSRRKLNQCMQLLDSFQSTTSESLKLGNIFNEARRFTQAQSLISELSIDVDELNENVLQIEEITKYLTKTIEAGISSIDQSSEQVLQKIVQLSEKLLSSIGSLKSIYEKSRGHDLKLESIIEATKVVNGTTEEVTELIEETIDKNKSIEYDVISRKDPILVDNLGRKSHPLALPVRDDHTLKSKSDFAPVVYVVLICIFFLVLMIVFIILSDNRWWVIMALFFISFIVTFYLLYKYV